MEVSGSYVFFFCAIKALTSLHKTEVKPLRSHGLFNDVFTNFLGSGSCLDCQCRDRKLSEFIKKRSSFVFQRSTKVSQVWNDIRV